MTTQHVYEHLANVFCREGVSTCFALLGDANMNWAAAMVKEGCQFIYVRDEHNAVSAAMSWSRATDKVGIATVTCGPGVTQILTALPAAVRARIPLVIFAGEAPLKSAWYNQAIDQAPLIKACGAIYHALHQLDRMPMQIRDAFIEAQQQQLPVVLGVPFDLQNLPCPTDFSLPTPAKSLLPVKAPVVPDKSAVRLAADRINVAQRIILVAGRGALQAGAANACRQLATKTGALLATTLPARGLFHEDTFCLGIAGGFSTLLAREFFSQSDLIIVVGGRLASHMTDAGKLIDAAKVLHIDINPATLSQGRLVTSQQLRGDAKLSIEALLDSCEPGDHSETVWRSDELAYRIANEAADTRSFDLDSNALDPRDVVSALDALLPKDWDAVNSSGHCSYFFAQMRNRPAERFHTIREFGAIGNGLAYAMGVAVARNPDPVVLFDGDGSFLMHVQELETMLRHGLNVLICVLNDGAYGSEIHKLRAEGLAEHGAVFGDTDIASIASGFAASSARVQQLEELPALLEKFVLEGGIHVWDFPVSDQVVSPVIRRAHSDFYTA